MTYLFLGQDTLAKDVKLTELKKQFLKTKEAFEFDLETLYAQTLAADELKKSLLNLPVVSKKRVVVIKDAHKLSPYNKGLIEEFTSDAPDYLILILDSEIWEAKDSFVKKISPFAKVTAFEQRPELNVFALTNTIAMRNSMESLKILTQLLVKGDHPLQIMGGLVWYWGKSKDRMPSERFKKGLLALEETDLNIKRSRLKGEYALEVLIVKLCS